MGKVRWGGRYRGRTRGKIVEGEGEALGNETMSHDDDERTVLAEDLKSFQTVENEL